MGVYNIGDPPAVPTVKASEIAEELRGSIKAVSYESQTLTDEQKAVARKNTATPAALEVVDTHVRFPTFDGLQDVVHLDVVRDNSDAGIFGYRYWCAYTGMPANREHPQVAASHDGLVWEVPNGCKNPIVTRYADLLPVTVYPAGDASLFWDGSKLRCYFMGSTGGVKNTIFVSETTDGKAWSVPVALFDHGDFAEGSAGSPSVVSEGGDNLRMFYFLKEGTMPRMLIATRTSADDGDTWTAPVILTQPSSATVHPSHVDVEKVGDTYHFLIHTGYYFAAPAIPYSAPCHYATEDPEDIGTEQAPIAVPWLDPEIMSGAYRGCLVPRPDGNFDMYLPCFRLYSHPNRQFDHIEVCRWRNLSSFDGTENRIPVPVMDDSVARYLAPRRAVVLDQDVELSSTAAPYCGLASRTSNPWGLPLFAVPIRHGQTARIRAFIRVGFPHPTYKDNMVVTVRPAAAQAVSCFWKATISRANNDTAVTPVTRIYDDPTNEGFGLLTAYAGSSDILLEVEGIFTYERADVPVSMLAVRVYPQSNPATYGNVIVKKGSYLEVSYPGSESTQPTDTVA